MTEALAPHCCHRCGAPAKWVNGRLVLHDTTPWGSPGLACLDCYRTLCATFNLREWTVPSAPFRTYPKRDRWKQFYEH